MIKAGLRKLEHDVDKTHRKQIPIDHGFRMFFCSQLVNADLNTEKRYLLEGHSLLNNDKSYVRVKEELHDEYIKAIPFLTIDPKNKLEKEVKKLTEQNNETIVNELEHKRTVHMLIEENNKTKQEMEKLKETSDKMFKWMQYLEDNRIKQIQLEQGLPKDVMDPVYEARRKRNSPPWEVEE